jgi:F0F1-type ATP synthase assembly protein I
MTDNAPPEAGNDSPRTDQQLSAGSYAGLGIQFAIGTLLFLYIGKWIDAKLGTSPAFLIAGVFLGAGGSFYLVYRKIAAAQKRDDEIRAREKQR